MGIFEAILFRLSWMSITGSYRKYLQSKFRKPLKYFATPEAFYSSHLGVASKTKSITHDIPCVGRDSTLADLIAAVDSAQQSVLIISGAPGIGKSRLGLEFARKLRGDGFGFVGNMRRYFQRKVWRTYFVVHGTENALDRVSELPRKRRTVIFVDDAHERPELVQSLVTLVQDSEGGAKILLVCLCRSSGVNPVLDSLSNLPLDDVLDYPIGHLTNQSLEEIVSVILPRANLDTQAVNLHRKLPRDLH